MPSGAKRRKAAKKKMEKIVHEQEQGNGDSSKSHDEKDSDSGSVSSPTTSHENQNPLRRDVDDDEEEKFEQSKGFSASGVESAESKEVFIEKSQSGGEGEKVEEINWDLNQNDDDVDQVVTKEVDSESRVINIEPVKDSKFGDSFGSSSNGKTQVVEKKIELQPEQIEELSESKEGAKTDVHVVETLIEVEPTLEVVPIVKEVVHDDPVKQVVYQSERAIHASDEHLAVPIAESSVIDSPSKDRAEKMLPLSNGASVETSNGSEHPTEAHTPENSNSQKELAPVLPIARPTSWKSCCGLFDVLVGSNR
ncbi:hypothetical protein FRX31_009259 [Thalictrum thalictroides]|uniref:Uncharacterized protein n=1 Tax=Thalictrum thalictroides TaxID=46969 RepID=A0A7J6WUQ3_THATH|nr:hypothetical protein FRX31_009259 [Thalictrum thalictroides]